MGNYKVKLDEFELKIYKKMLRENAESDSQKLAIQYAVEHCDMSEEEAKTYIKQKFRMEIQYLNGNSKAGKFTLGAFRLFTDMTTQREKDILNTCLEKICSNEEMYRKYNKNLNGLDLQDLETEVNSSFKGELKAKSNMKRGNYKIVKIKNFTQSSEYGDYTSWCVTHSQDMYARYTQNGSCPFYFLLREGFENEEERAGNNAPLDSYGLSMIAVCVNYDGSLKTCTCRWNHDKGGNDHIMTKDDIEALIGKDNAESIFTKNAMWGQYQKDLLKVKECKTKKDLKNIFYTCENSIRENILKANYQKSSEEFGLLNVKVLLEYYDNKYKVICEDYKYVNLANKDLVFIDVNGDYDLYDVYDTRVHKYLRRNLPVGEIDWDFFTYLVKDEDRGKYINRLYSNKHGFITKDKNGEEVEFEGYSLMDDLLKVETLMGVRFYDIDENVYLTPNLPEGYSYCKFAKNTDNYFAMYTNDPTQKLAAFDKEKQILIEHLFERCVNTNHLSDLIYLVGANREDDLKIFNLNNLNIDTNSRKIKPNATIPNMANDYKKYFLDVIFVGIESEFLNECDKYVIVLRGRIFKSSLYNFDGELLSDNIIDFWHSKNKTLQFKKEGIRDKVYELDANYNVKELEVKDASFFYNEY